MIERRALYQACSYGSLSFEMKAVNASCLPRRISVEILQRNLSIAAKPAVGGHLGNRRA